MRSSIIVGCLCLGVLASTAAAQRDRADDRRETGGRPEQIDQALKERYGKDATAEIVGQPTEVNGVRVYQVRINTKRGDSTAMVTEYGDFLLSGLPSQFKGMPRSVQNTRALFKTEPQNAEQFIADGYYIDLQQSGDNAYRVRYDAVGRLREVANPEEVERFETTNFKKADESTSGKIQELAEKHIPEGSKIKDVYIDPRYEGFYVAKYTGPKNKEVLVILDEQGNVFQTRTEISPDELPKPVRDSFNRMFDEGKIKWAYRTQYQYYQFDQQTPDGDRVTFKVRPNGQIMDVQSRQADRDEEAVTARFKERAGGTGAREGDPQPARDRERERERDRERDRDR